MTGSIYHKVQIDLTYNSKHMEGSRLTHDQTRYIFQTNTIGFENDAFNVSEYKKLPSEVSGNDTTLPENVAGEMRNLLADYNALPSKQKPQIP